LPQGWALKILKLLMAGSMVSRSDTVLYTKFIRRTQKCRLFNSGGMEKRTFKIIKGYEPKNIYNVDETGLFFWLPHNKTQSLKEDPCKGRINSKQRISFC
jgi:hypothetical protein